MNYATVILISLFINFKAGIIHRQSESSREIYCSNMYIQRNARNNNYFDSEKLFIVFAYMYQKELAQRNWLLRALHVIRVRTIHVTWIFTSQVYTGLAKNTFWPFKKLASSTLFIQKNIRIWFKFYHSIANYVKPIFKQQKIMIVLWTTIILSSKQLKTKT